MLGEIWRAKDPSCACGWGWCSCAPPGRWCRNKRLWRKLAEEAGRTIHESPFGVVESMTCREADASGVTVQADLFGKKIMVGGAAGNLSWLDLCGLSEDQEVARSTLMILGTFGGSRLQKEEVNAADRTA